MCVAAAMEIVEIAGRKGTAALWGNRTGVDLSLVPNARIGDFCLVHAGAAISLIDKAEADEISAIFGEIRGAARE